jgi:hypothetical protein
MGSSATVGAPGSPAIWHATATRRRPLALSLAPLWPWLELV